MLKKSFVLSILVGLLFLTAGFLAAAEDTNTGEPAVIGTLDAVGTVDPDATIVFDLTPGTGAPPPTLGGHAMTPVPYYPVPPTAPACTGIAPPGPIPTPMVGTISVSPWDMARCINLGWASWSHGYEGDVYFTGGALSQSISLPPGTAAFYFYVEPNPFSVQTFTVVADGVSSGPFTADGNGGATYVGVYDSDGGAISSIDISCDTDFASGEYGWAGGAVETGTIEGHVTDMETELPIFGAFVVAVELPSKDKAFKMTNNKGFYQIPGLDPAYYFVLCLKKGYNNDWKLAKVEAGATKQVDFSLVPVPASE